ncbi:hypothetical protein [Paenibacillus sp. YIM B09110]|uniref:hypothetical protein n=1 Tax=Paenibacillus sp. YIM B09110 TaxID=3126102 RepID=UPI00301D96E2
MTLMKKNLHWSAVIGVACSFWLLFWLFCMLTTLYDLKHYTLDDADSSGQSTFLAIVGVFALWTAYRARQLLALLRYGEFSNAKIVKRTEDSFDAYTGITSKMTMFHYSFLVNKQRYTKTLFWTFGLKKKNMLEIVFNTQNPGNNAIARRLRARFDDSTNQWRSSMWHVIPRLIFLVITAALIFAILFMDTLPWGLDGLMSE